MGEQASGADGPGGRIALRFQARDVNVVMGPAAPGTPVRYRVCSTGSRRAPRTAAMSTPRATARSPTSGCTSSSGSPDPSPNARVEITFLDPGAQVFAFTFG